MLRLVFALMFGSFAYSAALADEQPLRNLSGEIFVLERITLPGDTVVIVDVTTENDHPLTGLRRLTEDAQSPFGFSLDVPADQALVLRVGLRGLEDALWLSEPVLIEPGENDLDIGAQRALRLPLMGFVGLLYCGSQVIEIGFLPEQIRIRLNEQIMTLSAQPAASGVLYSDPDNPATSLHMKGDGAVLRIDGAELSECTLRRPDTDITQGVWNISAIEDTPVLFPSRTELVFYPDGRLSASVGCNRLIGNYRRFGGVLTFGRLASTLMACPDGMGEQEARFNAVLPKIDGYILDAEAGRLTLTTEGRHVLRARK